MLIFNEQNTLVHGYIIKPEYVPVMFQCVYSVYMFI